MSRLRSRLDRLEGGFGRGRGFIGNYLPIEDIHEWPNEVGDFTWSRMGVFYRKADETVGAFVERVYEANQPPRALADMTDAELERSAASWSALFDNMKPEYRDQIESDHGEMLETLRQYQ